MRRKQIVVLLLTSLLVSCTGKKYLASDFEKIAITHKKIAVLPFVLKYQGRVPQTLSSKDELKINTLEGLAFQQAAYNSLLGNTSTKSKTQVTIQPLEITNNLLQQNAEVLENVGTYYCNLLGVDAVIICRVSKERLYTNLSPLGIKLPVEIYKKLKADSTDLNNNLPQIPGNAERTYTLKAFSSIRDNKNKLLWQYESDIETNWSANEVREIERLTQRLAKNFPYNTKAAIN